MTKTLQDVMAEAEEQLREYFDKTLKAKKPTVKNLDRELLVYFQRKHDERIITAVIEMVDRHDPNIKNG